MEWFWLAVASYFVWALVTILDKIVLGKWLRKPAAYLFTIGIVQAAFLLASVPFAGFSVPAAPQALLAAAVGLVTFAAYFFYAKTLLKEEASRASVMFQLAPLFTFAIAFLVVGERLSLPMLAAFALLVCGGLAVSVSRAKGAFKLSDAAAPALATAFLFGVSTALTKLSFDTTPWWDVFVVMRVAFAAAAIALLLNAGYRRDIVSTLRRLAPKPAGLVAGNNLLDMLSIVLFNYAVALGPVSVIHAMSAIHPLLVLALAAALSAFAPRILREELARGALAAKLAGALLVLTGIFLLYTGA